MRYLVTGGTGFIGHRLVRQLRAAGHEVVALVRDMERAADLRALGADLVRGDITDPTSLPAPMVGADGVFHLAAWYHLGARDSSAAYRINVEGTRNVLDAAGAAAVPKVVYTSTIAVFGDTHGQVVDEDYRMEGPWLSEYDRTKWLAHYQVALPAAEAGLPLVIVQPGIVYGPGDHSQVGSVLRDYLRRRLPVIPPQGGCWSHVGDSAAGHVLAMERGRPGRAYVLAGPCMMWKDVLSLAEEITGIPAPRITLPPWAARAASWAMKPVAAIVPVPETYHPETLRVGAGSTYFADDTRARREIGWAPRPVRDGLRTTLEREQAALEGT